MRRFTYKTVGFLLPLLVVFIVLEMLVRNIPNDYSHKKYYLDTNAKNIETLILGSSHSYYGLNPEYFSSNTFNASHISQSIDLDYRILKKYSKDLVNLKQLILPVDYFTLYYKTATGIENWRLKNYNIYYNIKCSNELSENSEMLALGLKKNISRVKEYYFKGQESITCTTLGFGGIETPPADLLLTGKEAALRHTYTTDVDFNENVSMLNAILKVAEKMNVKVVLVTNPAYSSYVENLNPEQLRLTTKEINRLIGNYSNIKYFNLLNNTSFNELDYRDADHLNINGSRKLSIMLNTIIEESTTK